MAHSRKPKLSSHSVVQGEKNHAGASDSEMRPRVEYVLKHLEERFQRRLNAESQRLLLDVANLRGQDAPNWFWKKWQQLWPETPQDLIELRDELQEIWRSDRELSERAASGFKDLELVSAIPEALRLPPASYFLNKWLSWRPSAEQQETRRSLNRNEFLAVAARPAVRSMVGDIVSDLVGDHIDTSRIASPDPWENVAAPFTCSLFCRRLLPQPRNLRAMLVQGVLETWGHFKFCANPHCVAPYFIAKRKDQTVCDAEICKAEKQREHARKWWNENRAKNSQKKAVSKMTGKGTGKNVTHKAR